MMTGVLVTLSGVLLLGMAASGMLLLRDIRRQERFTDRVRAIHGEPVAERGAADLSAMRQAIMGWIAGIGRSVMSTGLVSRKTLSDLEKSLAAAGVPAGQGLALFVGCKIVLVIGGPFTAWLFARHLGLSDAMHTVLPAGAAVVGLVLPDWIVEKYRARYLARLEEALPDALDMMVICAQAGLGLGPAVIRVSAELRVAYAELAYELGLTANELQISTDSRVALTNLGLRTNLDSLKRLGTTLIQTVQYGTPLTEALRVLSAELRHETLVKMETRAARLPVMLTMPMIVFILPCVFIIAGGPAMMQIMKMLQS